MRSHVSENAHSADVAAHWRSDAREKLTFAANGLLMDLWSFCACQRSSAVSAEDMRRLCAPDPKNAQKMLAQLAAAGFVEATPTGWEVAP